ncbi:MAG: hypothetical protein M3480_10895, partial [Verrucomicrobiota bacterium]|nr:hypothetical protein [Verrucomicrobiota bacterium]
MEIWIGTNPNRVSRGEFAQRFRQYVPARHFRVADQHRDQRNLALQRAFDFDPDMVGRIVEAPRAALP